MLVKMQVQAVGSYGLRKAGQIVDVGKDEAEQLIEGRYAVAVEPARPATTKSDKKGKGQK